MNGWGGHGHNDVFNFEFAYKGLRFIVDSGTYCYTSNPELRQKFRSTSSHNTIIIDDTEQAEFLNLFRIKEDLTNPKVQKWASNTERDILIAEHYGYTRLKHSVVHRRKFEFDKKTNSLTILDSLDGQSEHKVELFYHFHPDVDVSQISSVEYKLLQSDTILNLEFRTNLKKNDIRIEKSLYSKSYGVIEENERIHLTAVAKLPVEIATKIRVV